AVGGEADVHAAGVAGPAVARARGGPERHLVAPGAPRRLRAFVDQATAIAAGQAPDGAGIPPPDGVVGLGVPDRRAVVVPDPVAPRVRVAQDAQVRLRGAEGLAVQDGPVEPARVLDLAAQAFEA